MILFSRLNYLFYYKRGFMKKIFIALVLFTLSSNIGFCGELQNNYEKTVDLEQISNKLKYLKTDYKNYLEGENSLIGKFKADYDKINPEHKPTSEPNAWTLVRINTNLADSIKTNKKPKYLNIPDNDFEYLNDIVKKDLCLYNNYFTDKPLLNYAQQEFNNTVETEETEFMTIAKIDKNNDDVFEQLLNKYKTAIDNLNMNHFNDIDEKDKYYKNSWVKLHMTEGCYVYTLNYTYLQKKYGKYLSKECNQWLKHMAKAEYFFEDGGLAIPVDELRKYIIELENLTVKYSNFASLYNVQEELNLYVKIYLLGADHTPVFDRWSTLQMDKEFKASYEKFLKINKNSHYYAAVNALYSKAKENNFKLNERIDYWIYDIFRPKYIDN